MKYFASGKLFGKPSRRSRFSSLSSLGQTAVELRSDMSQLDDQSVIDFVDFVGTMTGLIGKLRFFIFGRAKFVDSTNKIIWSGASGYKFPENYVEMTKELAKVASFETELS